MRESMPQCAAWIDDLRDAFGRESVDGWIRQGIAGGKFYAEEGDRRIGRPVDWDGAVQVYMPPETVADAPNQARKAQRGGR